MKVHRGLVEAVINGLDEIFNAGRYADKAIEKLLKQNRKWGARDRGFIAENIYETVRWWRLYEEIAQTHGRTDRGALWDLFAVQLIKKGFELPNWKEFQHVNAYAIQQVLKSHSFERKVQESIPDWLDEMGIKALGIAWDAEVSALNQPAPLVIRTNTLKISRQKLQQLLLDEHIETDSPQEIPDALILRKRINLFGLSSFKSGLFEVQDGGSQLIAPFLKVEPGMRVVDACAGAGGKSMHLAALMQNKGRIIAMDTEDWKLDELMRRAKRDGVNNIETRVIDSNKVIKRLEESADRLLLDVPCSGLGVLRRNPDAKWKLKPEFIENIKKTQQEILSTYSNMLKPGGMMVYATCSIMPQENEQQVDWFLKSNEQFTCLDQRTVLPSAGFDGFFMALLKKN